MKNKLQKLYDSIPTFKCKDGCTKCCGPMPWFSDYEWSNISNPKFKTKYYCPYKEKTGCMIYNERPFICRLFGTVEGFTCSEGCQPEKLLTRQQGRELKIKYFEEVV